MLHTNNLFDIYNSSAVIQNTIDDWGQQSISVTLLKTMI